jgi:hypothetical protein
MSNKDLQKVRPTKSFTGGPCITAGHYSGGSIPGIYPVTTRKTGGSAVPGVAPTTGFTQAAPRPTQVTVTITSYESEAPGARPPAQVNAPKAIIAVQVHNEVTACRQYADVLTNDW